MTVSAPPSARKSTVSTPSVSIVMLPTSRKNRSRLPFADRSMLLGGVGAVEEHRVGAVLAFDGVAAVARIPDERVVAGAHERQVVAAVAVERVVPVAAEQRLDARCRRRACRLPRRRRGSGRSPRLRAPAAEIASLPPRPLTASSSVGSWCWIATSAGRPDTVTPAASPATSIVSSAVGAVDDDAVGLAVAGGAAGGACEVDVHARDVGAGEVVDGDDVGAAEGVEVDPSRRRRCPS